MPKAGVLWQPRRISRPVIGGMTQTRRPNFWSCNNPKKLQPFDRVAHLHTVRSAAVPATSSPKAGFEDFYRSQWAEMVRLAWLLCGSKEDGEDVVHDAFLRIERRFPEIDHPPAYLRKAVINGVLALRRRREVERRHPAAPSELHLDPELDEVWLVIRALPERERHALVLRFYLDLSVDDVAVHMGCPVGTAKSLIHRGVKHVRRKLEP